MSTIKHVLVTGGGGYIGSVLVPYLLRKKYKVTVIDRFFFKLNYKLHKNLTIVKDDTQNIDDQTLKKIDCVIDLVAIANDVSGDYFKNQTIKTNYLSRLKTAKLAKKNGVQQYILPSSASVYGFKPNNIKVDENTKPTPLTHYSKNNLKAENEILNLSSSKFNVNIMRQGTIFGFSPRLRLDLVINNFVFSYSKYQKIRILRNGKQMRPFLHIKDTSRFMEFLIKNNSERLNGEIFNIGDASNSKSILDIKRIFEKCIQKKIKHEWYGEPDYRSYNLTFEKINTLGFKCKYDIQYGIQELLNKLKNFQSSDINYTLKWYKNLNQWDDILKDLKLKGKIFI